jgi:hypothetical protein
MNEAPIRLFRSGTLGGMTHVGRQQDSISSTLKLNNTARRAFGFESMPGHQAADTQGEYTR